MDAVRTAKIGLATGIQLHYAERGPSDGEAVLLIHGWPDSWFSWSRVAPLLPPQYRVFAIDQRGFGESDKPASGYRIADLADDAAAFLDAVGVPRATVVGHSFGSFVARRLALAHPQRVARLALIGSALTSRNKVTQEVLDSIQELAEPVPLEFSREFQASTIYLPVPTGFFEGMLRESVKLPARLWRETLNGLLSYDDAERVASLKAPTILLWGDHDGLFSRAEQDRLLAAIPGACLTVYEETGHCPNWERPEEVASDLAAFMSTAASGKSAG
jgi:non-heme chloroperoxidase